MKLCDASDGDLVHFTGLADGIPVILRSVDVGVVVSVVLPGAVGRCANHARSSLGRAPTHSIDTPEAGRMWWQVVHATECVALLGGLLLLHLLLDATSDLEVTIQGDNSDVRPRSWSKYVRRVPSWNSSPVCAKTARRVRCDNDGFSFSFLMKSEITISSFVDASMEDEGSRGCHCHRHDLEGYPSVGVDNQPRAPDFPMARPRRSIGRCREAVADAHTPPLVYCRFEGTQTLGRVSGRMWYHVRWKTWSGHHAPNVLPKIG